MNISVFTTPTCGYCRLVKEYFQKKGIQYKEFDVSENEKNVALMVQKSDQMGVPVILIENNKTEHVIVGFDKKKIDDVLGL